MTAFPFPYYVSPYCSDYEMAYAPTYATEPFYYDDCYYVDYDASLSGSSAYEAGDEPTASEAPAESEMDVWLRLGDFFLGEGNLRKAAEAYRKAKEAAPKAALPRIALGETLFLLGEYAEAAIHLRKAIEIDPTWLDSEADRREIYPDAGVFDHAMEALNAHRKEHPFDASAEFVAGYMLYFTGDRAAARAAFDRLKEILMEDPVADRFLARLAALDASPR